MAARESATARSVARPTFAFACHATCSSTVGSMSRSDVITHRSTNAGTTASCCARPRIFSGNQGFQELTAHPAKTPVLAKSRGIEAAHQHHRQQELGGIFESVRRTQGKSAPPEPVHGRQRWLRLKNRAHQGLFLCARTHAG